MPAEMLGLVGLSGRLRPLAGLMAQQACTIPIVEHAKPNLEVKRRKGWYVPLFRVCILVSLVQR
jgi:hypothetical protein